MSDRIALPLLALLALALIALALVWPQGLGRRSPAPFGHPVAAPRPSAPAASAPATAPFPATAPLMRGEQPLATPQH